MAQVREARFLQTLERLSLFDEGVASTLNRTLGETQLSHLHLFKDVEILESLRNDYHIGILTNRAADNELDSQLIKAEHLGLLNHVDSL